MASPLPLSDTSNSTTTITNAHPPYLPQIKNPNNIIKQFHHNNNKPMPSIIQSNCRDTINTDAANLVVIIDRKVRLQDNVSLYSMCRSWITNGFPQQTQPLYLDAAKSLPRPLPLPEKVLKSPNKNEGGKEEEVEDEIFSENLSAEELLRSHVKRAKRIRSRLREERAERITRYKTRLALLLPPIVDQNMRNETN